jgi:transposase
MLSVNSGVRVHVHDAPTDMRRSFEGLSYLAREVMRKDPLSGHLFVFLNRSRSSVKVLYWDRSGYAIWYKTLQRGTFTRPSKSELDYTELLCILDGIEIEKMSRKARFSLENGCPR